MGITNLSFVANPQPQWLNAGDAIRHAVSNPAASLVNLNCYQDPNGENLLASIAPGGFAYVGNPGGFFCQAAQPTAGTSWSSSTRLYTLVANGTAVSNTTAETVSAQFLIPANVLYAGSLLRIRFRGTATAVHSTDTFQPILRFGAAGTSADTALITMGAVNPSANQQFRGEFVLITRAAAGATVAILGEGSYATVGAAGAAMDSAYLASTNFATNAPLYVSVTITESVANAGNSALVDAMSVDLI